MLLYPGDPASCPKEELLLPLLYRKKKAVNYP